MRQSCFISLKVKPPPLLTWSTFHGFFVDDWLCESEVSAPKQRFWCHPTKMHVLPSFPKAGYSEKCTTLLRGAFSLCASSRLIKQAQEMSLLAWLALCFPFGVLPLGSQTWTVSICGRETTLLVSLLTANLTFPSPCSFPLIPIYST